MYHTKIIGFILTVPAALAAMAEKAAPAAGAQGDSDRLGTAVAILVLAAAIGGMIWNFRRKVKQGGCACCSGCAASDQKHCRR